jgi:hypothetical protein
MIMVKVRLGDDGKLAVQFPYDLDAIAKIKTIPGRTWDPAERVWKIPYDAGALKRVQSIFAGDSLEIDHSLLPTISEATRRNIVDYLCLTGSAFHGRMSITDFLSRVWDLSAMPSTDSRFKDADGDIWQHMENNYDWDEQYLFYGYLHILEVPTEVFLKLLEQVVHPIVTSDDNHVLEMVSAFNDMLAADGYTLIAESEISGHTVYKAVPLESITNASVVPYDVVLSFAGEERPFVRQVANYLKTHGVKYFYDEDEAVDLWGKELTEHLDKIYGGDAKYCVMFISESYARKMWPIHERRSALARAVRQIDEYILPVRFDNTLLDGIRHTIGHIDATKKTPEDVAKLIIAKLKKVEPLVATAPSGSSED